MSERICLLRGVNVGGVKVPMAELKAIAVEAGFALDKSEVRLSEGPFRAVGEYEVTLHLYADVDARIKIDIVPAN